MSRQLGSWLMSLQEFVEETEAPRQFWLWAGISTIASALQRKVWLFFGAEKLYPNLFVLFVSPPATRKAGPVNFSRKILRALDIPIAADSSSKRRFTSSLDKSGLTETFYYKGKPQPQCAMSIISGEFSSIFAVNLKEMIEVLTDVYDSQDEWRYETEGKGQDKLYNVCVNIIAATTPGWIMDNLPQSAIGGGFTSRFILIYDDQVYKRVTIPWIKTIDDLGNPDILERQDKLFNALLKDLQQIHSLIGQFEWEKNAYSYFDNWYKQIDKKIRDTPDERLHPFIGRMHTIALKVAMALRVDHSDELILTTKEVGAAIELLENVLTKAPDAFGSHGRSKTGPDTKRVMDQIRLSLKISFQQLMRLNFRHVNRYELRQILETIQSMGHIKIISTNENPEGEILWIGKERSK